MVILPELENSKDRSREDNSFSGWGIPTQDYSFLHNVSNENNMRSKILELLSRINPNRSGLSGHRKLKDSDSSDDEDSIEFLRLESDKQNLVNQLRLKSMLSHGQNQKTQDMAIANLTKKIELIEKAQEKLNHRVFCFCIKMKPKSKF